MADRVADWIALLDAHYPPADAEDWDSTGLQVGDPDAEVGAVLVGLDVTDAVLDEAAGAAAGLVIAHHPLLFRPLSRVTPDTAAGRLALRAARTGVAVVAAHTNVDVAEVGTTEPVVRLLDLQHIRPLVPRSREGRVKLVTFVPAEASADVLAALAGAGAGGIGEYDHCSFRVQGVGTFRPSEAASPTVGERRRLNEVVEDRLEVVLPARRLAAVVAALRRSHPYEEVAYDAYPLVDADAPSGGKGMGRVGDVPEAMPLEAVADRLAEGLPAPHLRVSGDLNRPVRRVAACGGAGDAYLDAARRAAADCYVTGDLRHHPVLDARTMGMALIDAGHYATEAAALPALCARLADAAGERGLTARLLASTVRTEPWADYRPGRSKGAP